MTEFHSYENTENPEIQYQRYELWGKLKDFKQLFEDSSQDLPYRNEVLALLSATETLILPDKSRGTKEQRSMEIQHILDSALKSLNLRIAKIRGQKL